MDLKLKNKTAFISGSTDGIGFAIACSLLEEGVTVIINGRSEKSVTQALKRLKEKFPESNVWGIPADFSITTDVKNLIKNLPEIDILINNVGIFEPKIFTEISDSDWFRFFEVNVMSGVRLSKHILPSMLLRNEGRIIFISSESAIFIPEGMIHYGVTKTAILGVSRGLAELTKGSGVTVNTILPGPTKSSGAKRFLKEMAKDEKITTIEAEKLFFTNNRPTSLLQRFAGTEEVANTVVYFASPLASATNGAAIRVEGGIVKTIL